jgi:hypothetical protein
MRLLASLLLVAAAGCASAPRADGLALAGSYRLAEINGRPLPAESPTEEGVLLERGTLLLDAAGAYTLQVHARRRQQPTAVAPVVRGTYRTEGGELSLTPDPGVDAAAARFRFALDGGVLRLRDEEGNEFAFSRQ